MVKLFSKQPHSMSVCHYVIKNNAVRTIFMNNCKQVLINYIFRYFVNAMENILVLKCSWIICYCHYVERYVLTFELSFK